MKKRKLIEYVFVYVVGVFTGLLIWYSTFNYYRVKNDEVKCHTTTTNTDSTETEDSETDEPIDSLDVMLLNDEVEEDDSNLNEIYTKVLSYEDRAESDDVRRDLDDVFTHIIYEENYRNAMKLFDSGEYYNKDYLHSLRLFLKHPRYRKTLDKIAYILYYRGNESPYDINELIKNDDEVIQMIYNKAETFYEQHDYYNAEILYYYVNGYEDSAEKRAIILGDNAKSSR